MLFKAETIAVPADDPFRHDSLERKARVRNLGLLLREAPGSVICAVDGPWGSGKSTFLRLLRAEMEGQGHQTLWLDAWESDFVDDPLIALLAEMSVWIESDPEGEASGPLETAQRLAPRLGRPENRVGSQVGPVRGAGAVAVEVQPEPEARPAEAWGRAQVKEYTEAKQALVVFRQSLVDYARLREKEGAQLPIVFFVDELDRCRPAYAIRVLERIKHLFAVPGISFVLGMNREQLGHAIKAVYGSGFDSEAYLERLLDVGFRLPGVKGERYVRHLADAVGLRSACVRRGPEDEAGVIAVVEALVPLRAFTSRLQQRCVGEVALILRTAPRDVFLPAPVVAFLVVLRHLKQDLYYSYLRGEAGAETLLDFVESGMSQPFALPGSFGPTLRGYLYGLSRRKREGDKRKEALVQRSGGETTASPDEEAAAELHSLERAQRSSGMLREIADFIEFAGELSWESPA